MWKISVLLVTLGLTGCGMSPELRRDVFGYDPASESIDWSPFFDRRNLGLPPETEMPAITPPASTAEKDPTHP